jgi:hypothetical protein
LKLNELAKSLRTHWFGMIYIVGISQEFAGGIPFNLRRAADKFLFGLLFLNNGVLTQLTKMGLIKDRDEIDPDAEPILRIGL